MFKIFKNIAHYWQRRRDRFYFKSRWNLFMDITLSVIVLILIGIVTYLYLRPEPVVTIDEPKVVEKYQLDVNNPPLDLNLDYGEKKFLKNLGEAVSLNLSFNNKSRWPLKNVKVQITTLDRNFSVFKLVSGAEADLVEISGQEITFSELKPHETADLLLDVYFKARSNSGRTINWQALLTYYVDEQLVQEIIPIEDFILAAELQATAGAYYHSSQGDQLGSGPLPPVVSLPTNYWVFFDVDSTGDFSDLVFSAKLAPGVELTGNRALLAGNFNYNESLRQIIWTIPELNFQGESYRVGFEVQLIPSENQVGTTPVLLSNIRYYAHDKLIAEDAYYNLNDITTNLNNDKLNQGQGQVVLP